MSRDIIKEINLFTECLLCGMAFGLIYDCFRVYRKIKKHNRVMVDIEDFLYWMICFGISFCLLYYANNIVIRFFCIMAAAIGMWIYYKTVGIVFIKITLRICDFFLNPIRQIKNKLTAKAKHFKIILKRRERGDSDLAKEK